MYHLSTINNETFERLQKTFQRLKMKSKNKPLKLEILKNKKTNYFLNIFTTISKEIYQKLIKYFKSF